MTGVYLMSLGVAAVHGKMLAGLHSVGVVACCSRHQLTLV